MELLVGNESEVVDIPFEGLLKREDEPSWVGRVVGILAFPREVVGQGVEINQGCEEDVCLVSLMDGVQYEFAKSPVAGTFPSTVNVMVRFLTNRESVNYTAAIGKQVRLQDLDAERLLRLSLAENVELFQGRGPAPITFLCHNSPIE